MSSSSACVLFYNAQLKTNFLTDLLAAHQKELDAIYTHPFNLQLFAGTLKKEQFARYLHDDIYYLKQFSTVLSLLSIKTQKDHSALACQLDSLARDLVGGEQDMQRQYSDYLTIEQDHDIGSVITSYSVYLTEIAEQQPFPVALSALLPCFWIYAHLGKSPQISPNPYDEWIQTYSSSEFIKATEALASTVDYWGNRASPSQRREMAKCFKAAVDFEYAFFDEILPQEQCGLSF